jgi:hypothetical protein
MQLAVAVSLAVGATTALLLANVHPVPTAIHTAVTPSGRYGDALSWVGLDLFTIGNDLIVILALVRDILDLIIRNILISLSLQNKSIAALGLLETAYRTC